MLTKNKKKSVRKRNTMTSWQKQDKTWHFGKIIHGI